MYSMFFFCQMILFVFSIFSAVSQYFLTQFLNPVICSHNNEPAWITTHFPQTNQFRQSMQKQWFPMKFREQFIAAETSRISGSKIDQIYLFRIRSPAFLLRFSPE